MVPHTIKESQEMKDGVATKGRYLDLKLAENGY
jgi:hypothetical protein